SGQTDGEQDGNVRGSERRTRQHRANPLSDDGPRRRRYRHWCALGLFYAPPDPLLKTRWERSTHAPFLEHFPKRFFLIAWFVGLHFKFSNERRKLTAAHRSLLATDAVARITSAARPGLPGGAAILDHSAGLWAIASDA